ncbi:MAG: IS91 family transposase [Salinibacterium sp.]|nr:MAG: IS91 family transposase [Salinibacterium sp.]
MHCAVGEPAARPALEVAEIVRVFGEAFRREHTVTPDQAEVLRAIVACRTPQLGGHLDVCDACGFSRPSYNSCRNRHCPKCQALAQAAWIGGRERRILPVSHFHVVFTVPDVLHRLAAFRREVLFDLIFAAASQTLAELARSRFNAELGATMVLHTWTRDLRWHPHVHAIVTAGGLAPDARWQASSPGFLFPVHVMGALYRGKFLAGLRALYARGAFQGFDDFRDPLAFHRMMAKLAKKRWVVYAKRPFGAAHHVLAYLGRYTHRVGISNRRLLSMQGDLVTFATKNGRTATITGVEFLRRFTQHVLPKHYVKIRHFGLYAASNVHSKLETARALLASNVVLSEPDNALAPDEEPAWKSTLKRLSGIDVDRCPECHVGSMIARPLPQILDSS